MRLAVVMAGGAFLLLALGFGGWFGAGFLHRAPQPHRQLTVRIDPDAVPEMIVRTLFTTVRDAIREPRIGFAAITPSGDSVEVTISEGIDRAQALARLRALSRSTGSTGAATEMFTIAEAPGAALRLTPTPAAIAEGVARTIDQTIDVLGGRIDSLGLKPAFDREGDDRIVIEITGQPDTTRLKATIVTPGKLAFRFVDTSIRVEEAKRGRMPPQSEILQDRDGTPYLVEKRISMTGENLLDAQPNFDQRTNEPMVTFRFNAAGTRQFARMTEEKVGSPMAVVLDGVVLAVPVIREPIVGGSGQISGAFTVEHANDLAILLRSGALPAPLTIVDERTLAGP